MPEIRDPVTLMNELLVFYDASIADGSLQSIGPEALEELIRRWVVLALTHYEAGRVNSACHIIDLVYKRTDGVGPQPDLLHGPALDDVADRVLDIMASMGCDL